MSEYITKEQVIEWFRPYGHLDEGISFETLAADIRCMKSVDSVEVVRCRDCKHWEKYNGNGDKGFGCCGADGATTYGLFYCANGEKDEVSK